MGAEIFTGGIAEIVAQAAREHPREACGLLIGRGMRIERLVPAANVAADPLTRFEVDPATLLRAHREAREAGGMVIGCYHSHPNGRQTPSAIDARAIVSDGEIWLIAADGEVRAFVSEAGQLTPIGLSSN